jgi:hypothetical protein
MTPASGLLDSPVFADEMPKNMNERVAEANAFGTDTESPLLFAGDLVIVANDGNKQVDFTWNRKANVIVPGAEKTVLFEAACNVLGDPRSGPDSLEYNDGTNRPQGRGVIVKRYEELCRLFARYGICNEAIESYTDPQTGARMPGLVDVAPRLRVRTMSGVAITFPVLDPHMDALPIVAVDPRNARTSSLKMFEALEADNADLRKMLGEQQQLLQRLLDAKAGAEPGD